WRVTASQERGYTGDDLDVALGEAPLDPGVIEVDAEHRVPLSPERIGQRRLELRSLEVHRGAAGKVTKTPDRIVVDATHRGRGDVAGVDAHVCERIFKRIPGARELELRRSAAPA